MVMEQIVILLVDPGQNLVFVVLLTTKLKTLAPSLVLSNVLAHRTFALTWEKWMVSDHI
jgi:hypothetical protein